jgi:hypothetical protein
MIRPISTSQIGEITCVSYSTQLCTYFLSSFFLVGMGFELYCLSHTSRSFALVILEMVSHKLFAQAGLKPKFSQSQPPK